MDINRSCNAKSILYMFLVLVSILYTLGNGEVVKCVEKEKQALLKFKGAIIDQYNILSSWGSEANKSECCSWRGVVCSNMTGHVIRLELYYSFFDKWDLFSGTNRLVFQNLDWLSNLSSLSVLGISYASFTQSLETIMFRNILMIPSLKELYLLRCDFPNTTSNSVHVYVNSTSSSLSHLDLSGVGLTSLVFHWLFNIIISTSLVSIDLSHNQLDGPIPDAFGQKFVFLEELDLSSNRFEGGIPNSLQNLTSLKFLDLSHNRITGPLPESVGELLSELEVLSVSYNSLAGEISESHLSNLHNLKSLDLSNNKLVLNLSHDWTPPFHLDNLNLASCNMGPRFPAWFHTQINVSSVDLSCANISAELPERFWDSHPKLEFLNLSHNHISGVLPGLSFGPLISLDISFNDFSGRIPSFQPTTIAYLYLSNNKFVGTISFVCKSNIDWLELLDLSNNQLSGQIPNCWDSISVSFLDLSNNSFSGNIPNSLSSRFTLYLGNNNLSGELPIHLINSSRYLVILDVGGNKLTGNIPIWIGTNFGRLMILNIRDNKFFGSIPPEICSLTQIQVLDLSRNNLSGRIPLHCFKNFTNLVQKSSKTTKNDFDSSDLYKLNTYYSMNRVAVQWKGHEFEYSNTLPLLKLIDLSSNRIEGNIPTEVFQMEGLISLNLSRNHLTGSINPAIHMESLEVLDLSRNQLSGDIPSGLGTLSFLNTLDLSNNNFSGKIPPSTQLQSFNASVYVGNVGLCGPPLQRCPEDGKLDNGGEDDDAFTNQSFLKEFYITIVFGFIVGFWGTIGTLILKKSWRYAYFNFFDSMIKCCLCLKG